MELKHVCAMHGAVQKLKEHLSARLEAAGSNLCQTNTSGLLEICVL